MKVSTNWLKEFVDAPADAAELGKRLTHAGLALESIEERGDDRILELDITTNRPDCLSHLGVAREVSALYAVPLKIPEFTLKEAAKPAAEAFSIAIEDSDLCSRYCGRFIAGVKIGPSPDWLKHRLEAVGIRSINNVADVTNYVMMELGHPMHAFDADNLAGRQIIVRRAGIDEKLTTLDGVARELNPSILVIADAEKPVALAGIMGGGDSEISNATTNVFLESAYFTPNSIRKTARSFGMSTEASYRFERGADVAMAEFACARAAAMIHDLAGGEVLAGVIDVYPGKRPAANVTLKRPRIGAILGAPVEDPVVDGIFDRLGFKPQRSAEGWTIEVPSFRVDISADVDLVEEIARHHGFDRFPTTFPASKGVGALLPNESRIRRLRGQLSALGYSEICTYAFSTEETERRFYPDLEPVRLLNPMSEDASILRTSLVPGILSSLQWNANRGNRDLQFYELGNVYSQDGQRRSLIFAACGDVRTTVVHALRETYGFFTLKGDVVELLQAFIDVDAEARLSVENIPNYYHPGRFARIGHLAIFGELHPDYAEPFKFRQRVYIAEIDVELLLAGTISAHVDAIPKFPAIRRDFSLLLARGTQYATVRQTIADAGISELVSVEPFDRLESGPFPDSKYSLSISVIYQSAERTLTDVEVESFDKRILQALEERLGAQLRK